MAGRLEDLFGANGLVISGTARVTVVIGCLVMLLIEAKGFKNWLEAEHTYYLSEYNFECNSYRLAELLLFLFSGLIGLVGASRSHLRLLKMFVFLMFSSLVFSIVVHGVIERTSKLNKEVELLCEPLENSFKNYDWSGDSKLAKIINVTKSWDATQKVGSCCGIHGYQDWDIVRPRHLNNTVYPVSCCSPANLKSEANPKGHQYCHSNNGLFVKGCREALKDLLQNHRFMGLVWKFFYFVVLLMAFVPLYDVCGLNLD